MKSYLYYNPAYDHLTPEEEALLAEDADLVEKAVRVSDQLNAKKIFTRNAHATSFGFVRGRFIAEENLAGDFAELFGGENLGVIMRYSHPNFIVNKCTGEYPLYGCSVKIYNKNQPVSAKFPLVNLPVFITNSVSKFLKIHINANRFLIAKGKPFYPSFLKIPAMLLSGLSIFADRQIFRILRNMVKALDIEKQFIATYDYHSVGCFRFGDRVMKIRLKPNYKKKIVKDSGLNQTELLQNYFLADELTLDFQVQMGINEKKTPVNDLLKLWKEKDSKFITVGKIILPQQDITSYKTIAYENLSFNPFENLDGLKPVGRIQKIRQQIYNRSVATRQALNKKNNPF
ncbi:catalase family protein [Kaistella palustris]|uniref:hypothetical protein n=1 Tax=Kaistella palustris TaxID=493376 RepID=UPI0003F7720C|nr:hypothetical protein [Kaistella palustris]